MENFIENQNGQLFYSSKRNLQNNVEYVLSSFNAIEKKNIFGLKFGALLSDPAAWSAGVIFTIKINNATILTIEDEIGDLLRPAFLPISIKGKDKIELTFKHSSASLIDVSSTVLIEAF